MVKLNQVSSLSGHMSMDKIIHFKNSLSVQLEAQKLRINILLISHIHK